MSSSFRGKKQRVAVIGAGAAGLYAAQLVQKVGSALGMELCGVYEAAERAGGRVRVEDGFLSARPVDIGGEYVHGSNSLLYQLAQAHNMPLKLAFDFEVTPAQHCYYHYKGQFVRDGSFPIELQHAFETVARLGDHSEPLPPDVTVYEYLKSNGVSEETFRLVDSIYGRTGGTSITRMGAKEAAREDRCFTYGHDNYRFRKSTSGVLSVLQHGLKHLLRLNWQAKRIEYDERDGVTIVNQYGETVKCDYVIIAVPVTVLRDGDIEFSPPLPKPKLEAAKKIKMEPGAKLILKFSRRFWPEDVTLVVGEHPVFPQVWSNGPWPGKTSGSEEYTFVAFVMGEEPSNQLKQWGLERGTQEFLSYLNTLFGTPEDPTPANSCLLDSIMFDFGDLPFIRGAYTSSSLHAFGLRRDLAEPVANRVFFAGEATSQTIAATIHTAMETGARAVCEIATQSSMNAFLTAKL